MTAAGVAAAAALGIARGWWIGAWVAFLLATVAGVLIGRRGEPAAYILAAVALGLLLIATEPALNP